MEEQEMEQNHATPLSSHEILRMSIKNPMTKIKKIKKKKIKPNDEGLYECDKCDKVCKDHSSLVAHKAIHSDTANFACTICPYKGKTKKYLARHLSKVHTEPTKYTCDHCGKKFHYLNKLECHRRVHTGEKPYKCQHCGKEFSAKYSLNTHLLLHSDEKPFKCSFCDYACRDSSTLRKHQNRHMGLETVYQCKKCNKSFKKKFLLKNHVAEEHLNLKLQRHKCDKCDRQFKRKAALNQHIKSVHKKLMRCKCKICGLVISTKYNMKSHIRVHTASRPFKCDFEGCDKAFKDSSTLKKHNIIHYPSKHMPCKVCGKLFTRARRLERHVSIMHKERKKNAKCQYCGVCFYSEVYLRVHYRKKHDKKRKRYKCDLCDFFTSNKPSIVMHLKYGHAKDNDVECKICNIIFKKQEYLKMHYTRKHNMRYKPMKRVKKKPKKPQLLIKEEPVDVLDDKEIMELLTDVKEEPEEPRPDETDSILYSDAVFSEDVARSYIKNNSEKLTKLPEDVFDTFFVEHVYNRYLASDDKEKEMDKEEEARGIQRYKEFLSDIIGGPDIEVPEGTEEKSKEDEAVQDEQIKVKQRKGKATKSTKRKKSIGCIGEKETDVSVRESEETLNSDTVDITQVQDISNNNEKNKVKKIKFNMHQCYVCFQVFDSKHKLTKHCAQHYDVCNETQLKKCPLCTYVTKGPHFSSHMRKVHSMRISCNYSQLQENVNGKKYSFKSDNGYDIEVVPSIKNLNKREYMKIDKINRISKDKSLTKTKLVRSGNEWIVAKEDIPKNDYIIPNLGNNNDYLANLKKKYKECKRNGQKMLFPCKYCEKTCQSLSGLTLHFRRHEKNSKPFKKKVWKHKLKADKVPKDVLIDGKYLKIVLEDCMKNSVENNNGLKVNAKRKRSQIRDPLGDPKPVTSRHKCDKTLIEFYKNNIKGSDIQFWHFLKIFNKMSRENIEDFKDLEKRYDFGMHIDNRLENANKPLTIDKSIEVTKNINKIEKTVNRKTNNKNSFKRVRLVTKREYNRREEIKQRMREKIRNEMSSK